MTLLAGQIQRWEFLQSHLHCDFHCQSQFPHSATTNCNAKSVPYVVLFSPIYCSLFDKIFSFFFLRSLKHFQKCLSLSFLAKHMQLTHLTLLPSDFSPISRKAPFGKLNATFCKTMNTTCIRKFSQLLFLHFSTHKIKLQYPYSHKAVLGGTLN